ncbi:MAG: hypothetical protein SPJ62_15080 [Inconstantimicrobium porci]|uniref:hypothetical protein n=1 Tax=Inconstantimicrobium porci TaxID=2652291 RepID=UPI002A920927|nr:hypothetical protein [Inconstantimicrobium porci]MDY5913294.1 hypothetical protein [Inconstantimicrobium porci]
MYVNNDKFLESTSNECNVQLKMPSQNELIITPESQRISTFISENKNIISSIASIERSNSSILSGEADLLSSSKKITSKENEINLVRDSIKSLINASSMLEHILCQDLEECEY